ncbi:putative retroelement, partial [Globisporangium splendens]
MEGIETPMGSMPGETVELTNEHFPHLSSHEWAALEPSVVCDVKPCGSSEELGVWEAIGGATLLLRPGRLQARLKKAFEPPQSEFRARAEFLKLRQGKYDLHSYAQRARYLVSSIVNEPIDASTQVVTFMAGLNDGPIRNQLFREYPKTLDEAIERAMQEEFSIKQAKFNGFGPRPVRQHAVTHDGPEPMDISYADATTSRYPRNDGKCFRCGKPGHIARNCKVSLPSQQATHGSQSNRSGRGRRFERSQQPKNGNDQ